MKNGSILAEAIVIIGVAIFLGTAVHFLRWDKEKRIEWVKTTYTDCFTVKNKQKETPPPPPPVTKTAEPPASSPVKTVQPKVEPVKVEPDKKETPSQPQQPMPPPPPPPQAKQEEGIREITVDEAIQEHKNGTPFLDARRTRQFKQGHIPGARSVSVWESGLEERISLLFNEIPFEMPVVVYCSSGDCEDSHQLATNLKIAGYKDIRVMRGGFPEWTKKGQPVEKEEGAGGEEAEPEEKAEGKEAGK